MGIESDVCNEKIKSSILCFVLAPGNDFRKILGAFKSFFKFILEFLFFHCQNQFAVLVASVSPSSLVSNTARTNYYCFFEVDDRRHFLLPLSHE